MKHLTTGILLCTAIYIAGCHHPENKIKTEEKLVNSTIENISNNKNVYDHKEGIDAFFSKYEVTFNNGIAGNADEKVTQVFAGLVLRMFCRIQPGWCELWKKR